MRRLFLAALLCPLATLAAQSPPLRVELPGRPPVELPLESLRRLRGDTISFAAHGAPAVRYRAVRIADVLAAAGRPLDSLRTGHAGWIVAALARDGYSAVFTAAELDSTLGPSRAWLAFERDTGPLMAEEGPYRLIVPTDKKASRAAHQVVTLRVLDALPSSGGAGHRH